MSEPEALALVEFASIAAGTRAADALVKKAPVRLERMGTLQPGKLAVLFTGDVASVELSWREALRVGEGAVADQVFLPHVEASVYRAALGTVARFAGDTLGVIEATTMAATVEAADAAVKGASVRVLAIRLGDGLGGKGVAHLSGAQHDVEAAVGIGAARARRPGRELWTSVTARLDGEVRAVLERSTRFWRAGEGEL
jgi:microcompartment protein CcmL/EutN